MLYILSWAVWVLKHAFDQTFAPAPRFNVDSDIPDLTGKVVLVTGGNTGIGYDLCLTSLRKGAKVYMACRSEEKAQEAIHKLRKTLSTTPTAHIDANNVDITFLPLDLSSLGSIHTSAAQFLENEERLDVLFCNAGVMIPDRREITKEGYDMQFGVNVLGHHVLVGLLKPALTKTNTSESNDKNRIIFLSSIGHTLFPPWYTQAFVPSLTVPGPARDGSGSWWATGGIGSWGLYGHSKMGNILSARWFQKELGDSVVVTACHPGLISTELYRTTPSFLTLFTSPLSKPPSYGALTPLYLGFSSETSTSASGGRYYVPWAREVPGSLDVRARGEEGMRQAEVLDRWVGECVRKWRAESGDRSDL